MAPRQWSSEIVQTVRDVAARGGSRSEAARIVGLTRHQVGNIIEAYGVVFDVARAPTTGLTLIQSAVLAAFRADPEATPSDIARAAGVKTGSVASALESLELQGLIKRPATRRYELEARSVGEPDFTSDFARSLRIRAVTTVRNTTEQSRSGESKRQTIRVSIPYVSIQHREVTHDG